jgi:bifunctional UDP-N-acetylglucosamine pyrophosphorylase / glucosamine-1-phosphate N-acetyltransferase
VTRSPSLDRAGLRPRVAVVLAAGKGTRMRSDLPKVLHRAAGRPLLDWVLAAARAAGCGRLLAVVGHGAERVREEVDGRGVEWVLQAEQRGTGHALAQAEACLAGERATLLVLSGDVPLVRPGTLVDLMTRVERPGGAPEMDVRSPGHTAGAGVGHRAGTAGAQGRSTWGAMAVADLDDPGSLGRVLERPDGALAAIVEARDASPEVLAVRRVNAGLYVLPAPEIFDYLRGLSSDNSQGELYLTDALTAAAAAGERIELVPLADPAEGLGVNDRAELAAIHRRLIDRHLAGLMKAGVTVLEPARTTIEPGVEVGADTVVHPDVSLLGATRVGRGCTLHQGAWLRDTRLGEGVTVEPYSVLDGAEIEEGCRVGPFARLRPGSRLRRGARVGNFVEVKNAELGPDSRAGHLAYLGDATIGEGANIGAGTVTCNFDGTAKHRTEIGRAAFIGSDTLLVAPVKVGERAATAAGSVITKDVPDEALAVGRARQKNLPGRLRGRLRGQARAKQDEGGSEG